MTYGEDECPKLIWWKVDLQYFLFWLIVTFAAGF